MTERIYLDWNATAPLRPQARAAMIAALDAVGNPSSIHTEGRAARHIVETAREQVAAMVGAEPRNVLFTAGGTEANMLALSPKTRLKGGCERLVVSAIEHPSVRAGGRFLDAAVETVAVTSAGEIDLAGLERRMATLAADQVRPLVSIMLANNETGVVQPICEVARVVHNAGGLLHVDAVQAAGRITCDIGVLGADLITLSGHKIGGPKGIGALVKRDHALDLDPLVSGGGQERGARAGTENVAGIAGFGAAAAAAHANMAAEGARMRALRDGLEAGLRKATPAVTIFGAEAERLPNTTLFAAPGMKAETSVIAFDLEGVAVSSGAACSSGKVQSSHVLAAMGILPLLARGAVRVSLGPTSTESDIERFLTAWIRVSQALSNKVQDQSQGIAA
jgi:cysteine desulfurase